MGRKLYTIRKLCWREITIGRGSGYTISVGAKEIYINPLEGGYKMTIIDHSELLGVPCEIHKMFHSLVLAIKSGEQIAHNEIEQYLERVEK